MWVMCNFNLSRRLQVVLLAVMAFPSGVAAQDGGIEVLAGHTIFQSGTRISLSHLYSSRGTLFSGSDELTNPDDLSVQEHRVVLGVNYGLLPDVSLSLLLPYVSREARLPGLIPGGGVERGSSNGLGDAALLGKYNFFSEYWKQSAFHISVIGGLELPTGSSDERRGDDLLAFSMQPGSGTLDAIGGLALTLSTGRYRFDAHAIYKANGDGGEDFTDGDFFSLGGTFAYRFYHARYPGPSANAKIGLNWRHEGMDEDGGEILPNTGLDELRLRAALVYHPSPEIDLVAQVEIPVYGDYRVGAGDGQLALDVRTFFGFGIRF
ncbi:MAG: transporter [Planctomycetota bacterium]|nr:transporter [Planctomycetota bacterium]